jgi:hypothetical protein
MNWKGHVLLQLFKKALQLASAALLLTGQVISVLLWTNLCKVTVSTHVHTVPICFCYFHFVEYRENFLQHFRLMKNVSVCSYGNSRYLVISTLKTMKFEVHWKLLSQHQKLSTEGTTNRVQRSLGFLEEEILIMVQTLTCFTLYRVTATSSTWEFNLWFLIKRGDRHIANPSM